MTMINVNITGLVATIKAFSADMVTRGRGHIITMSSVAGRRQFGLSLHGCLRVYLYVHARSTYKLVRVFARHDLRDHSFEGNVFIRV